MGRGGGGGGHGGHSHSHAHHSHSHVSHARRRDSDENLTIEKIFLIGLMMSFLLVRFLLLVQNTWYVDYNYNRSLYDGVDPFNVNAHVYSSMLSAKEIKSIESELKNFYNSTGAQMSLVITDYVGGQVIPKSKDGKKYAENTYKAIYGEDQTGFVVLVVCPNFGADRYDFSIWYYAGDDSMQFFDARTCKVIYNNFYAEMQDGYYWEQSIVKAVQNCAEDVPHVKPSLVKILVDDPGTGIIVFVTVVIPVGIIFALLLKNAVQKKKEKRELLEKYKIEQGEGV